MSKTQPAFPVDVLNRDRNGMSLRDYFAAKAMQGMLSNQVLVARFIDNKSITDQNRDRAIVVSAALTAYAVADAMLEERYK